MKFIKSPNFSARNQVVTSIVLHYTQVNLNETLKIFLNKESELSAHYVLSEEGDVIQMVEDEDVAWHSGVSSWRGIDNLNHSSLGIEIVNDGISKYPDIQIRRLIDLLDRLRGKFDIKDVNIVGHSDIAPLRKDDPGKLLPWNLLAKHNHGLYVSYEELCNSNFIPKNLDLKTNLCKLGYSNNYCSNLAELDKVKLAFANHFAHDFEVILPELEIIKLISLIIVKS
ncbi:MAG: N-acetylmuramoyl-L-alanine amidase [Rickettsiales bacterium]|nr:N-acetylmuramoyl-L-alanine amidase [Rickettsiales bacterium]